MKNIKLVSESFLHVNSLRLMSQCLMNQQQEKEHQSNNINYERQLDIEALAQTSTCKGTKTLLTFYLKFTNCQASHFLNSPALETSQTILFLQSTESLRMDIVYWSRGFHTISAFSIQWWWLPYYYNFPK